MGVVLACRADVSNLNASPENVATTGNCKAWKKYLYLWKNKVLKLSCNWKLYQIHNTLYIFKYRIVGNFRGRKLSRTSRFESHLRKFSSRNLGHATPTYAWFQAIRESFLHEILTSYGSVKVFSLESLPLYGTSVWKVLNSLSPKFHDAWSREPASRRWRSRPRSRRPERDEREGTPSNR